MSDRRREIRVDKRLTAREMHEPDAVAFQDVAGELCLGEGSGGRDDTGSLSRAKLQKPQRALQALVMAKWQVPELPSQTALAPSSRSNDALVQRFPLWISRVGIRAAARPCVP